MKGMKGYGYGMVAAAAATVAAISYGFMGMLVVSMKVVIGEKHNMQYGCSNL